MLYFMHDCSALGNKIKFLAIFVCARGWEVKCNSEMGRENDCTTIPEIQNCKHFVYLKCEQYVKCTTKGEKNQQHIMHFNFVFMKSCMWLCDSSGTYQTIFLHYNLCTFHEREIERMLWIFFLVEWDFENFYRIPKKQIKSMLDNICIFMIEGGKKRQEKCIKQFIREKKKSHPKLRIWETR